MIKWIIAIVLTAFITVCILAALHEESSRYAHVMLAKSMLPIAAKDFQQLGYVTNVSSSAYQMWLSTNVAVIGGTTYVCYVEIGGGQFEGEGTLAMTTNGVFIWRDKQRPPKIIDASYRPRLFPSAF